MTTLTLPHSAAFSAVLHTLFVKPVAALGRGMVYLAEHHGTYMALKKIAETSDAALAAQNTTREKAIQRVIGGYI